MDMGHFYSVKQKVSTGRHESFLEGSFILIVFPLTSPVPSPRYTMQAYWYIRFFGLLSNSRLKRSSSPVDRCLGLSL